MRALFVIVCGSRDWSGAVTPLRQRIETDLHVKWERYEFMAVIEGGAQGVDRIAGRWAARMRSHPDRPVGWLRVPADWATHGQAAGPVRNGWMLDYLLQARTLGHTVGVLAYPAPRSRGTWDMVRRAEAAGVPVIVRPPGQKLPQHIPSSGSSGSSKVSTSWPAAS